MDASAYPLARKKGSLPGPDGGALLVESGGGRPTLKSEDLRVNPLGDRSQIPVKLAAGKYIIEVSVRVLEGDATYYFRVVVA